MKTNPEGLCRTRCHEHANHGLRRSRGRVDDDRVFERFSLDSK